MELYNSENVRNYGVFIDTDDGSPGRQAVEEMLTPLLDIDIDSFMTPETVDWCTQKLQMFGHNDNEIRSPKRPYINSYLALREEVKKHQESGLLPTLQLTPIPRGGFKEYVSKSFIMYDVLKITNKNIVSIITTKF